MDGVLELDSAPCVPDNHPMCTAGENCACLTCESGEDLLVQYEWDGGEFITEGSDENIVLDNVILDEEGEPVEVCFTTEFCEVDAVVKAGQEYESYTPETDEICVTGIKNPRPSATSSFSVRRRRTRASGIPAMVVVRSPVVGHPKRFTSRFTLFA
jgi:hypothetical protein